MSDIIPVFLGADLNCYNFARAFHEAYGVESYAYGRYPMAPTKYSKIIHFTTVPDMDNEDTMLRILHEFAAQHKGKRLYLFGCTDDYAAMIIRRKAELTEYIAPGPAADLYGSIQKKAEFYEVCEKFGIPYPDSKILTAPVDAAELTEDKLGFAYPIIVKPSSSVDYWKHPFDTMKKVYTAATVGTVLPGVTRRSCLQLFEDWGMPVEERLISVDELFEAAANGTLEEAMCVGTAAVISPIGELCWGDRDYKVNDNKIGALSQKLYDELTGIQWGTKPDPFGWVCPID
mgnify:CR=1 FL=1